MMIEVVIMITGNDADDSGEKEGEEEEMMMIMRIMMKIDCANCNNNNKS